MEEQGERVRERRHRERGSEGEEAQGERERERRHRERVSEGEEAQGERERERERVEAQGERGSERREGDKNSVCERQIWSLDSKESSKNTVSISIS